MSEMRSTEVRSVRIHMMLYCCGVWKRMTEDVSTTKDPKICKKLPQTFLMLDYSNSAAWSACAVTSLGCLKHLVVFQSGHPAVGVGAKSSSLIKAGLLGDQEDWTTSQ